MKTVLLVLVTSFASAAFADCYAPWGQYVSEGMSVMAYREQRPPRGVRCEYEYRYCNNGYLSGYYSYSSCQEDYSCYDFDFGYMSNMMTVTAYLNSVEYGGNRCRSETRQCYYGTLTGSYRNRSCYESN